MLNHPRSSIELGYVYLFPDRACTAGLTLRESLTADRIGEITHRPLPSESLGHCEGWNNVYSGIPWSSLHASEEIGDYR